MLEAIASCAPFCVDQARGTFGELLQGELPDGSHFLVTLPISLQSKATFLPDLHTKEIRVFPSHKKKVKVAIDYLLRRFDIHLGGLLMVQSEIPEGKGLASSSADIVASIRSVSKYLSLPISPSVIEEVMRQIEPSDGVMYEESVTFYHREVRLAGRLGELPPMIIVAADTGGIVDSIQHNRKSPLYVDSERYVFQRLLEDLRVAIARRDLDEIGRVSTMSAEMNQKRLYKDYFDFFMGLNHRNGICGTVIAHSGTMIGSILNPYAAKATEAMHQILQEFHDRDIEPMIYTNM
ncbi:uncharacterized protein involved in propanediol utilization [Croceifilum oryzae]|uniref:Uncharacterized protein involved in propanediol utilization n=2 Tax=Croceifilum oryzae TaxID=1553429 RepID=A0AAJ1WS43_9BACL|nr:uncharacterized protein involved in propanediol utilization [Croceifilum oryzae]